MLYFGRPCATWGSPDDAIQPLKVGLLSDVPSEQGPPAACSLQRGQKGPRRAAFPGQQKLTLVRFP
jgi:hypothetical protein